MALPRRVSDESDSIYKVETIPPPDGDDDAYSAATKVGPLSGAQVAALMCGTEEAPPASMMRPRRSDTLAMPVEMADAYLDVISAAAPLVEAPVASAPVSPTRAPAFVPPAFEQNHVAAPVMLLRPVFAAPAPSTPVPAAMTMPKAAQRSARSRAAFVVAMLFASFAILAIGSWTAASLFLGY